MATTKPRITITFDYEIYEVIERLAHIQGIPKSKLVNAYLVQLQPHLEDVLHALELVQAKQDPSLILSKMLLEAKSVLQDLEEDNK